MRGAPPALPPIASVAELDALRGDRARWLPAVSALAEAHGLAGVALQDLGGGNLVVAAGTNHVIKLTAPVFRREIDAEAAALAHIGAALPVPRLIAHGEWLGWPFVILTRLPGAGIGSCRAVVPAAQLQALLRAVGAALRSLHSLVPPASLPGERWAAYLARESVACVPRQRAWGLAPALVDDLPGFLAKVALAPLPPEVLLHADLTHENVIVRNLDGRWELSGLIDFGDAMTGDPLFDLVAPALLIGRGDPALIAALLDGYQIPRAQRDATLRRRLMALAALHRWNDLSRYAGWVGPVTRVEALSRVLFPLD